MAEHALITERRSLPTAGSSTGRRRFGAALLAISAGSALTSGIAAGVATAAATPTAPEPDAELIAACQQFSATELRCNALMNAAYSHKEDEEASKLIAQLRGDRDASNHWQATNRMCITPGSSHAAAVALATALAIWTFNEDRAPEDDPAACVDERITAALLRCLLGSAVA